MIGYGSVYVDFLYLCEAFSTKFTNNLTSPSTLTSIQCPQNVLLCTESVALPLNRYPHLSQNEERAREREREREEKKQSTHKKSGQTEGEKHAILDHVTVCFNKEFAVRI